MGFAVFLHRADSIYDDSPAERYHFPAQYLSRVAQCVGDWIVYYEPVKVRLSRGYFAVARVEKVVSDPAAPNLHFALIAPGTYLDFVQPVAFADRHGPIERGLLNEQGAISGRAQAAVRSLSAADFCRITALGLPEDGAILPRADADEEDAANRVREPAAPFQVERPRIERLESRLLRKALFRRAVLAAYDARCAVTGWKLINGGGREDGAGQTASQTASPCRAQRTGCWIAA